MGLGGGRTAGAMAWGTSGTSQWGTIGTKLWGTWKKQRGCWGQANGVEVQGGFSMGSGWRRRAGTIGGQWGPPHGAELLGDGSTLPPPMSPPPPPPKKTSPPRLQTRTSAPRGGPAAAPTPPATTSPAPSSAPATRATRPPGTATTARVRGQRGQQGGDTQSDTEPPPFVFPPQTWTSARRCRGCAGRRAARTWTAPSSASAPTGGTSSIR